MDTLVDIYNLTGSLFCHQLPERTIYAGGIPLPFCARDMGIYLGFIWTMAYLFLRGRRDGDRPLKISYAIALCILMVPMAADGLGSYMGFWNSTNGIRLFTGGFFGFALPLFLVPAANFKVNGKNSKAVVEHWIEIVILAAGMCALFVYILRSGKLPWFILSSIMAFSFLFFVYTLSYTIVARIRSASPRHAYQLSAGITFIILLVMFTLSNFVLQPLKNSIIGF